uniref:FAF domain-containing protein n=1 Tax=Salix viminalis TaxID=40686 RepID=A0A6N2KTZ5_SALVM
MMSFCKKSVHSFLDLTNRPNISVSAIGSAEPSCKCQGACSSGGIGLIAATCESIHKTPNILESTTIKSYTPLITPPSSPPPPPPPPSITSIFKEGHDGNGSFLYDIGGGADRGLMSCTEGLGFESSDEIRSDDDIELCSREISTINKAKWIEFGEKKEAKKFPPPLSSLNHHGQPNFSLKPVRKDGRLELTEVRIDRHEVLRASRQDGRLRLNFAEDEESTAVEKEYEQPEQEEYLVAEKEAEKEEEEEEEEEEEVVVLKENNDEESVGGLGFRVNGEGLRIRCPKLVAHHNDYRRRRRHHSNPWSQHCVSTR